MKNKIIILLCLIAMLCNLQKSYAQLKMASNGYVGVGTLSPSRQLYLQSYFYGAPSLFGAWQSMVTLTNKYTVQNYVVRYANSDRFYVSSMGKITSLAFPLYGSDSTLKTSISDMSNPIALLQKLHGVHFKWKADTAAARIDSTYTADTVTHIGFIAQEVKDSIPGLVDSMNGGKLAVSYTEVIPLLVEAVKAQQNELNEMGYSSCGDKSHLLPGGCTAFTKGDAIDATARYIESVSAPSPDSRRMWMDNGDNKTINYYDNQGSPSLQQIEIQSNKNQPNGYAGLDVGGKVSSSQLLFSTGANTVCQGNDSRLSDARHGKLFGFNNSGFATTSSTSEQVLGYVYVPAGTIGINDVIEISGSFSSSNSSGVKTVNIRWNTSSSLGGSLMASQSMTESQNNMEGTCRIVMTGSVNSQQISGTSYLWGTSPFSSLSPVSTSVNTASDVYILITGQKDDAGDFLTLNNYQVKILKP